MSIFGKVQKTGIAHLCLFSAVLIYGVFGLPTPDHPGAVEAVIGVFLALSVGFSGLIQSVDLHRARPVWQIFAQMLLLYGVSVSLLMGVAGDAAIDDIVRDLLPFLFLLMPLFFADTFKEGRGICTFFVCVVFAALCFAVRALGEQLMVVSGLLLKGGETSHELTYLANAPTILFACIFLCGRAFQHYTTMPLNLRSICVFCVLCALAFVLFMPMALTIQRASMALAILACTFFLAVGFARAPYRIFALIAVLGAFAFAGAFALFADVAHLAFQKTRMVGANMRLQELSAIWSEIAGNPLYVLLGKGWGAGFESPAVGNIYVRFSHSLLTSTLLKNGAIGVFLVLGYLISLIIAMRDKIKAHYVMALALLAPVFIDTFMYASFKSLDFGLILLCLSLLPALPFAPMKLQSNTK